MIVAVSRAIDQTGSQRSAGFESIIMVDLRESANRSPVDIKLEKPQYGNDEGSSIVRRGARPVLRGVRRQGE
jgi:hypothetical protein